MKPTKKLQPIKQIKLFFKLFLFAILAVFFMSSPSWAATYYVDATNGDDANTGMSEAASWKTISKVNNSRFQPGDFILFKCGAIWRETLIVPSSGSTGNPITFGVYGSGNKPVINGANVITGNWSGPDGNGEYNDDSIDTEPAKVFSDNTKLTKGTVTSLAVDEWDWTAANGGTLFLGFDPTTKTIEASQRVQCILVSNKSYIDIKNMAVTKAGTAVDTNWGAGVYVNSVSSNINIDNVDGLKNSRYGIFVEEANTVIIENCETSYNYLVGIEFFYCVNNSVVRDCITHHNDEEGLDVESNSDDILIESVVSYNNGKAGFDITDDVTGLTYKYCVSHDNGQIVAESGNGFGVWHDGGDNSNIQYINCIAYDNLNAGFEVYLDSVDSGGVKIYNCVSYSNVYGYGIFDDNVVLENCISQDNSWFEVWISGAVSTYTLNYNCYYRASGFLNHLGSNDYSSLATWRAATSQDAYSIAQNPLFTDASSDFTITSLSPAIDAGTDVGLTQDHAGNGMSGSTWDIGAYEYKGLAKPTNLRIIEP